MSDGDDLWTAIKARERNRSWVRTATLVVGAGALATAGVVAYTLPSPPQRQSASTTTPTSSSPQQAARSYGDDGGGDDGAAPSPAATPSQAPTHATTGGS